MKEETLSKLEFDRVRRRLASFCSCSLGKQLAQSIRPSPHERMVRQWLEQAREFAEVADRIGPPPMGGVHDVRPEVQASGQPAPLEGDALARVAETLEATHALRRWFEQVPAQAVTLTRVGERMRDYGALAETLRESIDARGDVFDHASPKLRAVRRTMEQAKEHINKVFDRLLSSSSTTRYLQYVGATFHDDRVVLPVRAEHRGRIPGIIHRSSDSGATLFIEPSEVVELNNTLMSLKEDEKKEITRILRDLTRLVHQEAAGILATLQAISLLDLNRAKWAYGKHYRCHYPDLSEDGRLELSNARHPVLLDIFEEEAPSSGRTREVVPIDVRLGVDFDALIITGPNTGGKTVALKTVGLLALMAQSGLPLPVDEGATVPVYRDIFVDIGDEQSLQQSLSTFSSHLSNQLAILSQSEKGTLVLIDELGAGTDPDEGAAIGRTLVEELLELGADLIVTTHLSALKALAYTTPRVDNGSVEFDVKTLKPTYRLIMGEPGNSNALIIAQRLGMSDRLIKNAKRHLNRKGRALDKAIRGTLHSRREAEEARKAARAAEFQAERQRRELEEKQLELEIQQESYQRWSRWINRIKPGDKVYVKSFDQTGKVARILLHKQTMLVNVGAFEMELPLTDVRPPEEAPPS